MTRPGSISTALGADIAEHHHDRVLRGRAQALAERVGDDVLQHHVDALLAGPPPDLAAELQVRADDDLVGAGLADDLRLVLRTGDRDHVRAHALHDLDLVQAESAARAGDQHDLARLDLRDAERRAHAGADRTDRERRRCHVETVRHADRIARRRAGELGIAAAAALAQHAAVAAEVLAAARGNSGRRRNRAADRSPRARRRAPAARWRRSSTISPAISWPRMRPGLAAGNLAAAREHVVIADAGGMNAHQHVVGTGLRPLDLGRLQHLRARRTRANVTAFIDVMVAPSVSPRLGERRRAFLVVVLGLDEGAHGLDLRALGGADGGAGTSRAAWSPAPPPANSRRWSPPIFRPRPARRRPRR